MQQTVNIALAGNPNSGKSSLFNALTGLKQKVGNFPGVTVDKKTGSMKVGEGLQAQITDLPGTYSLYPKSPDEYVVYDTLLHPDPAQRPDMVLLVADATNLKRNLLFCTQIMDLKKPLILVLTMVDIARKQGIVIDREGLERELGVPVVFCNPRKGQGISELKKAIRQVSSHPFHPRHDFFEMDDALKATLQGLSPWAGEGEAYTALHIACAYEKLRFLSEADKGTIQGILTESDFQKGRVQGDEVMQRYAKIDGLISRTVVYPNPLREKLTTEKMDRLLLHKVWGSLILLLVLFVVFQCVFWLASYPMDWIDAGFASLQTLVAERLPEAWWSDLLVNGLLAGIGGIVIFVPQIAILFGFIALLEDSGYMARISYLSDRLMRSSGLNGRSVMPLISGLACAIPAIMAARTIENRKERLITILVTPFMSCAARLPVYTILIALVVPETYYLGFINAQGLILLFMYLLGFFTALLAARVLSWVMRRQDSGIFLMELPLYRWPRWKNLLYTLYEKSRIFVVDAGKVILVISIVLWAMASYGPPAQMQQVEAQFQTLRAERGAAWGAEEEEAYAAARLQHSYAGMFGKAIEPAIAPLGYDWKMGIALIASFAAREVFVGTMATIYSVAETDENVPLKQKMREARHPDGRPVYTVASGFSLMIFYAFAMQCMSTLAIVRRETRQWTLPVVQGLAMLVIAYVASLITYQLLA